MAFQRQVFVHIVRAGLARLSGYDRETVRRHERMTCAMTSGGITFFINNRKITDNKSNIINNYKKEEYL